VERFQLWRGLALQGLQGVARCWLHWLCCHVLKSALPASSVTSFFLTQRISGPSCIRHSALQVFPALKFLRKRMFAELAMESLSDDTPTCWICLGSSYEAGESLLQPCRCSSRYVHRRCLARWVTRQGWAFLNHASSLLQPWSYCMAPDTALYTNDRWQLQCAGRDEERECRFCGQARK
jgi:hypothetical protein